MPPFKKKVLGIDMMEMTGPSKSERELKSMQSVGGSLIAENVRASSMMPKNLQGERGGTVLPAPSTVSVSTLQFAKTANHTGESTTSASRVLWKSPTSSHTVSNLNDVNDFPYPVSIATGKSNTTASSRSLSDLSSLMRGSGNSTKKKEVVPIKFIPPRRNSINVEVARGTWQYAHHVSKLFPSEENPIEEDLTGWTKMLREIHDFTVNMCRDALLLHLQKLSRVCGISSGNNFRPCKKITDIHSAVLKNNGKVCSDVLNNNSKRCSDDYLARVLLFLKVPHKLDFGWVKSAQQRVEDQYDITFPVCGDSNFVEDIAAATFNDTSNQRLRRGSLWYDRLPKEVSQKGTLKKYDVVYEKRELMVRIYRVRGYLVTRVHSNFMVGMTLLLPGVAEEDQLK